MLKATELMVGDWVIRKESSLPCRIKAIARKKYNTKFDAANLIVTDAVKGWATTDYYIPIPLTAKILKDNGFKFIDHIEDNYGEWKNEIVLIEVSDGFYAFNGCIHITYVHELQHALRLCGLNDLANNFKI